MGFMSKLFGRDPGGRSEAMAEPPAPPEPEPVPVEPAQPTVEAEAVVVEAQPEPEAAQGQPERPGVEADVEPRVRAAAEERLDEAALEERLSGLLDALGSAHRKPFVRNG